MTYRPEPSAADKVASIMATHGVKLDPRRLEETAAAQAERTKVENKDHLAAVRSAASRVVKAKRSYSQALAVLAISRTPGYHQYAADCKRERDHAVEVLRELCLNDEAVIGNALRAAH